MSAAVFLPAPQLHKYRGFTSTLTSFCTLLCASQIPDQNAGNKPPWTLPAKAAYGKYDSERSKRYFGVPNIKTPDFFPILSLLPQRALVYVKEAHPQDFIPTFLGIFHGMWEDGLDVSRHEVLAQVLSKRFSESKIKDILDKANSAPYKQCLNNNTKEALENGAFGCPWHIVRNSKGEEEPFFGSDRYVTPALLALLLKGSLRASPSLDGVWRPPPTGRRLGRSVSCETQRIMVRKRGPG